MGSKVLQATASAKSSRPFPGGLISPIYGGLIPEDDRKWEDLNYDEKIEKLMLVVTNLFNQMNRLEKDNNELRRHRHDESGWPVIQKPIGEDGLEEPGAFTRVNRNPFNVSKP